TAAGSAATTPANCATPTNRTDNVTTTVNGTTTTKAISYQALGGLLNTGSITAQANTHSQTVTTNGITTPTPLYIGPFATVPRLDVKAEAVNASTNTAARITALVTGIGQGSAFGVILGANSTVPVINVSQNASIIAQVSTNTVSPTKNIATASSPFSL